MLELDASAALDVTFGEAVDQLSGVTKDLKTTLEALFERHAIPLSTSGSGVAATGAPTLLDAGGPAIGRYWEIVTMTVVGTNDRTLVTGASVAFYVGATSMAGNLADLVLPATQGGVAATVPANAQFSRRQVIVQYPQHAYFLVYGAPNAQALQANIRGWDRDVTELPLR